MDKKEIVLDIFNNYIMEKYEGWKQIRFAKSDNEEKLGIIQFERADAGLNAIRQVLIQLFHYTTSEIDEMIDDYWHYLLNMDFGKKGK